MKQASRIRRIRFSLLGGLLATTGRTPSPHFRQEGTYLILRTPTVFVFYFLCFTSIHALASPAPAINCDIEGRVVNVDDDPIAQAEMILIPGGRLAVTDKDGYYCFEDVDPGVYQLTIFAKSKSGQRTSVTVGEQEGPVIQNVKLTEKLQEHVVVTATRTMKLKREVPIRTEVITRVEIDETGSRTLADAVEFTPGVRVESNCQNCNFSQVRLLGLDGNYSQILVDGKPLFSSLAMVYGIEHIPARMIEGMEVVKGGASSVYGPGAVGGVINVVRREPFRDGGIFETRFGWMEGSPDHSINGAYDWVAENQRASVSFFGQWDRVRPLDVNGDGFTEVSKRDLGAGGVRVIHRSSDSSAKFTADVGFLNEERRGGDQLDRRPDEALVAEAVETDRNSVALSWQHLVHSGFSYQMGASYVDTHRNTYYGSFMDPKAYGVTENPLYGANLQFDHHLHDHGMTWGIQYDRDSMEDLQPAYNRFLGLTYSNLGVFFQDDWQWAPEWELIYGFRLDDHSEIDNRVFSPRIALRVSPSRALTLRSSVSTGFRPPEVFDEDLHITQVGGEGKVIRNSPLLREEKSISLMTGAECIPRIGKGYGLFEFNAFYTALNDAFELVEVESPNPNEKAFLRVNSSGAKVYGVEVGLGYDFGSSFMSQLGVVLQRSLYDDPEPDFDQRDFFRTPDIYGVLDLTYRNPKLFEAFVGFKYTGPMEAPHYPSDPISGEPLEAVLKKTPAFLTIDLSLSKSFPLGRQDRATAVARMGIQNLANEYQEDLDQGPYRDAAYVYGPRFPRTVYISTAIKF